MNSKNEQPFTTYDDLSELNKWKFNRRKIVYKPPPVRSLDCFTSLEVIGEGTYGKVYKAVDKRTNKFVALKRMKMNNEKEGVCILFLLLFILILIFVRYFCFSLFYSIQQI